MDDFDEKKLNEQPAGQTETGHSKNIYTVGEEKSGGTAADGEAAGNSTADMPGFAGRPTEEGYRYTGNGEANGHKDNSSYTYSSVTPPYEQRTRGGARQGKRHGGLIALAVAGVLVLALLMGVLGAALAFAYVSDSQVGQSDQQNKLDPQGGLSQVAGTTPGGTSGNGTDNTSLVIRKNTGTTVVTTSGEVGDEDMSYADVAALVKDSVVEITTNYVVSGTMFSQYVSSGAGSGVVIGQEGDTGYIVTNNHVIENATNIKVRFSDGTESEAELIGTDAETDIAVIKVKTNKQLTIATLGDSDSLVVGQEVIAIGNPLGQLGGTVTNGIISALARQVTIDGKKMTLLQTNAAVNPGNSGGGLFNMRGELIGVVNAKSSGSDVEGLGFAIPVNTAYKIITELIEHGYVRNRPALGITVSEYTKQMFFSYYTLVYVVDPGTTELKKDDVITQIEGTTVSSLDDISAAISGKSVGDTVDITVSRGNTTVTVKVTLVEYVPN